MFVDRRHFLALASVAVASPTLALGARAKGRIEQLTGIGFDDYPGARIRIWLPADYAEGARAFPVLYMLDGQYAFETDSDGVNFGVDRRMAQLVASGTLQPHLIVAIDNLGRDRFLQYMPESIYQEARGDLREGLDLELARHDGRPLQSNALLRFLTTRLKPFVDENYWTRPERLHTAIFGASMAGVMAGAIFVEAQQVFGRGACMSPNWPLYDNRFIDYQQLLSIWPTYFGKLGAPEGRRLWLDHGTEMELDAGMAPHQANIADRLVALGWERGRNLQAHIYEGAGHAFAQTAVQMDELLAWMLA
ncbi:MAG TPA: alpha/beta hydrolase-fold protein [Sphingobium sp.]|nr:alpha/beta hydrolase-fold protein [Sphingobium sp.]